VIRIAAGGMHSAAVSKDGDVYTTGVNDEAALGRKTGKDLQPLFFTNNRSQW
jgi:regulator of chromosome condensation